MIKLKFNDEDIFYDIEFRKVADNVTKVFGDIPEDTSGFILYNEDGIEFLGNWSDYKTIYKIDEDGIYFSNNGSTYIAPPEEDPNSPRTYNFAIIWDYNVWDYAEVPDDATIYYLLNEEIQELKITKEESWQNSITVTNGDKFQMVDFQKFENYEGFIMGNSVIYEWVGPFDENYPRLEENMEED